MIKPFLARIIIIGVCCLACPVILSAQQGSRQVFVRGNAQDLYSYRLGGEYQRYLVRNANLFGFMQGNGADTLVVEYLQGGFWGKYSHLHAANDRLELRHPLSMLRLTGVKQLDGSQLTLSCGLGEGMELGMGIDRNGSNSFNKAFLGLSTHHGCLDYHIGNEAGNIPLRWINLEGILEGRLGKFPLKLQMLGVVPGAGDSLFANRVSGLGGRFSVSRSLSENLTASLDAYAGMLKARLNYKSEEYGKLDNLRMGILRASVHKTGRHLDAELSLNGAVTASGDDSYFDIWPFTFWDTFLASRTRIKKMQVQVLAPEAGITYRWGDKSNPGLQAELGLVYNHILHHEDVIHKNRIVLVYPFFFGYETFHYDWHDDFDACLRLPVSVSYHTRIGEIYLQAMQLAPFKWSKLLKSTEPSAPSEPSTPKTREWGGLSLSMGCCWNF